MSFRIPSRLDFFDDFPPDPRELPAGDMKGVRAEQRPCHHRRRPPPKMTPGQLKRHRRNLLICLGHKVGLSERWLADATDLNRSQVNKILEEYRRKATIPIAEEVTDAENPIPA